MSRHEDEDEPLGGFGDLSEQQRWAVSRFRARVGRYGRDPHPTNREISENLHRVEDDNETRRFGH